jgi:hypothetical protein
MSSIPAYIKQIPTDARNFVPVSSLAYAGGINTLADNTTYTFTTATWAGNGRAGSGSVYTSSINGPGAGKLRDMGKTLVSSARVFRKVQLIVPGTLNGAATGAGISTFGVAGNVSTTTDEDYLTGYIELGWEGAGSPAPVARAP